MIIDCICYIHDWNTECNLEGFFKVFFGLVEFFGTANLTYIYYQEILAPHEFRK